MRAGDGLTTPRAWAPVAAAGLLAALLYAATLMVVVSGCGTEYCVDVGEFQVGLATWGTVHHTGYPLYMLLGSPFVALLAAVGVGPAAGASLYSLVWAVAAVALTALIILRATQAPALAFSGAMLAAVFEPVWLHGSLAEVYSLSLVLAVALVALALRLRSHWSDGGGWLLALVAGLGVAHHRLLALLLPAIGLYLVGAAWRSPRFWRWLAVALVCFLAGFAPYLDMPARVWLGSTWNYGQPQTWDGFWFIFWGTETGDLRAPILGARELAGSALIVGQALARLVTWPGLVGAAAAAALVLRRRALWPAVGLLLGCVVACLAFAIVFRRAVLLEANLMPVLVLLVLLAVLGLSTLPRPAQLAGAFAVGGLALWLGYQNAPVVLALTRDQRSVALAAQLEELAPPPGAVVMVPWGQSYFALAFAQRVEGRFAGLTIVDHRADLGGLAQVAGGVYTVADTPYVFGLDWWGAQLGGPPRVTSAGPGWIELTRQPLPAPAGRVVPLGDGLSLAQCAVAYRAEGQQLVVTALWVAERPVVADYSTYAYVSDQASITSPDDLMAQSDFATPVYGWFPTSHWPAGEMVREDHVLELPPGRTVQSVFVGMYRRNAAGEFEQLGRLRLNTAGGECLAEPVAASRNSVALGRP